MKKIFLAASFCACIAISACNGRNPKAVDADSPMMTGKANQLGTVNDSSHTAADADSQAVGKKDGSPTDTTSTGSGKLDKQ